jgi:hypothetical protein
MGKKGKKNRKKWGGGKEEEENKKKGKKTKKKLIFYCGLHSTVYNKKLSPFSYCYNIIVLAIIVSPKTKKQNGVKGTNPK